MLIRQLEYFVALARERHFGRAAAGCFVSQPALSDAVRKLETELDVPLVRRGHTFLGLTAEGERLVVWARRLLADHDAMVDEARSLHHGLGGTLRIGSVPTASTTVAGLVDAFAERCPLATVEMVTKLAPPEVVCRLRSYELDAALSPTVSGSDDVRSTELYRERLSLIGSPDLLRGGSRVIDWASAATYPLAVLNDAMLAHSALDEAFAAAGIPPRISVQTDSIASLFALVAGGRYAAVVPDRWALDIPSGHRVRMLELVAPVIENPIHLLTLDVEPVRPLLRALETTAAEWTR